MLPDKYCFHVRQAANYIEDGRPLAARSHLSNAKLYISDGVCEDDKTYMRNEINRLEKHNAASVIERNNS